MKIGHIYIKTAADFLEARKVLSKVCSILKCNKLDRMKICSVVNTLGINIFEFAGKCSIDFSLMQNTDQKVELRVIVHDRIRNRSDIITIMKNGSFLSDIAEIGLNRIGDSLESFDIKDVPEGGADITIQIPLNIFGPLPDTIIRKFNDAFETVSSASPLTSIKGLEKDYRYLLGSLRKKDSLLGQVNKAIKNQAENMSAKLLESDDKLKTECAARIVAESASSKRQQALEVIFNITSHLIPNLDQLSGVIISHIAQLSQVPVVSISISTPIYTINKFIINDTVIEGKPFYNEIPPDNVSGTTSYISNVRERFTSAHNDFLEMKYAIGTPIRLLSEKTVGIIYLFFKNEKKFENFEEALLKTFARYIAIEIRRYELEFRLEQDTEMKTLGMITSGVAHEVRNPLNAIATVSEALFRKLGDSSQYTKHIHHIRNHIHRLTILMQDLLELGKPVREDNIRILPVYVFVNQAINFWTDSSLNRKRNINTYFSDSVKIVHLKADPVKLQQVLINLIDNATHFSPAESDVCIHVTLDDNKSGVVIKVVDKGPGIGDEYLEKFFEPFFSMRKGGTGLGTSIVKKNILLHGGRITVYNNSPPPGLCVEIWLPVNAGEKMFKDST